MDPDPNLDLTPFFRYSKDANKFLFFLFLPYNLPIIWITNTAANTKKIKVKKRKIMRLILSFHQQDRGT
jgi:hypothetical protein